MTDSYDLNLEALLKLAQGMGYRWRPVLRGVELLRPDGSTAVVAKGFPPHRTPEAVYEMHRRALGEPAPSAYPPDALENHIRGEAGCPTCKAGFATWNPAIHAYLKLCPTGAEMAFALGFVNGLAPDA